MTCKGKAELENGLHESGDVKGFVERCKNASTFEKCKQEDGQLNASDLENFCNYKAPRASSFGVEHVYDYILDGVSQKIPIYISPNCLTLSGLVSLCIGFGGFVLFHVVMQQEDDLGNIFDYVKLSEFEKQDGNPHENFESSSLETKSFDLYKYVCMLAVVSIFAYACLDSLDGKHARRTGQGSQFGAIFDHGCDAFSILLIGMIAWLASYNYEHPDANTTLVRMILPNVTWATFYVCQFEHYHLQNALSTMGTLDAITLLCGYLFLLAMVPGFRDSLMKPINEDDSSRTSIMAQISLDYFGLSVESVCYDGMGVDIMFIFSVPACGFLFSQIIRVLYEMRENVLPWISESESIARNSTSFWMHIINCTVVYKTGLFAVHPLLILLSQGLAFAHLNVELIVYGVCRKRINLISKSLIYVTMVMWILSTLRFYRVSDVYVERFTLLVIVLYQLYEVLGFVAYTIDRMLSYLGLPFIRSVKTHRN